MRRSTGSYLIVGMIAGLATGSGYGQDWTRDFRIGLDLGLNLKADFKTSGNISLAHGGATEFDDGYIRVDDTGNAQGLTSNWGYQNASQVNGDTLTFHKASSFQTGASSVRKDDSPYIGFEAAYGGTLKQWGFSRLGWETGFGFMPVSMKDRRLFHGTLTIDALSEPTGIILPDSPYFGTANSKGAPEIPVDPAPGAPLVGPGTLSGTRELDLTLFTLRLGPTYYWHFARYWGMSASIGPAIAIATGDYRFDEFATLTETGAQSHIVNKFGKTDVLYGGYVNALVLYRLQEQGDLFAGVQFMPLTGTTFSKGGRSARLDASAGIHFMAGVNWPF